MSIRAAIRDFLLSDVTLTDTGRNTAREMVRQIVGRRVFNSRRPKGAEGLAVTLSRGGGQVLSAIDSPLDCSIPEIDFTIWSRDVPGDEGKAERLYTAMVKLMNQYRGPLNDEVNVQTMQLEAEAFDQPVAPVDGTDQWRNRKSFSFMVAHDEIAVA